MVSPVRHLFSWQNVQATAILQTQRLREGGARLLGRSEATLFHLLVRLCVELSQGYRARIRLLAKVLLASALSS